MKIFFIRTKMKPPSLQLPLQLPAETHLEYFVCHTPQKKEVIYTLGTDVTAPVNSLIIVISRAFI